MTTASISATTLSMILRVNSGLYFSKICVSAPRRWSGSSDVVSRCSSPRPPGRSPLGDLLALGLDECPGDFEELGGDLAPEVLAQRSRMHSRRLRG
jgi:hypothetical protein